MSIENGGSLSVGGQLNLSDSHGALNLNGGSLSAATASRNSGKQFNWTSGTVSLNSTAVGDANSLLGSAWTLTAGQVLDVGNLTLNAGGTLALGAADRITDTSALVVNGGNFNLNGYNETVASLAGSGGAVDLGAGTLTAGGDNTSTSYAGTITGDGRLTKTGTGTLTLTGTNDPSGGTTVNGGTLQIGNGGTSGSVSGDITNNSQVVFNRSDDVSYRNVISGSGGLTKTGNGTLTLTGANTYTGGTIVSSGTLEVGDSRDGDGSIVGDISNFGTVRFTRFQDDQYAGVISGSGKFIQIGPGKLTLNGANTYTGATRIENGRLAIGASERIADTSALGIYGGTFYLDGYNETVGSLAGTGGVSLGAGTLTAGGDNTSTGYAGAITGSGGLAKTGGGTLTLTGANTYTGATTVNAGVLKLGAAERIANASALVVNGGSFDLNNFNETVGSLAGGGGAVNLGAGILTVGADNASTSYAGTVSGTGGLTKTGTGTLTLASSYAGTTTASGGTLAFSGDLDVGSAGTKNLTIQTGGRVSVGGSLNLGDQGRITLNTGELAFADINLTGSGVFDWRRGTVTTQTQTLEAGSVLDGVSLTSGKTLNASNGLAIGEFASLTLNGGQLTASSLGIDPAGSFNWQSGRLTLGSLNLGAADDAFGGYLNLTSANNSTATKPFSVTGDLTIGGTATLEAGSGVNNSVGHDLKVDGVLTLGTGRL
ncbi:MAG: autotransporter-associated beta strand repeat-containing protein, partial [Candidatus Methylumidiphilus sp.]